MRRGYSGVPVGRMQRSHLARATNRVLGIELALVHRVAGEDLIRLYRPRLDGA